MLKKYKLDQTTIFCSNLSTHHLKNICYTLNHSDTTTPSLHRPKYRHETNLYRWWRASSNAPLRWCDYFRRPHPVQDDTPQIGGRERARSRTPVVTRHSAQHMRFWTTAEVGFGRGAADRLLCTV